MHKLFTDGGSRNNPGPAAIGFVLIDGDDVEVTTGSRYIGEASNNYAEYMGLIAGLQTAITYEVKELSCYLDSELVVKQLKGEYKMRNESLLPLFNKVKDLLKNFKNVSFNHVPRSQNKTADLLVNKALDEALKKVSMTDLEQSIIDTLKYSNLFSFALSDEEIYKYLIGTNPYTYNTIKKALIALLAEQKVAKHANYYYINESSLDSAKMRLEWHAEVDSIKKQAINDLNYVKRLWFVKFVGITGSVAAKSLKPGYDIDLFIICNKNTVWLTRFIFVVYLKLKKLYKTKYCANIYINNKNLKWSDQNVYVANEIARLLPVYNKNYTYEQFLIKNKWVTNFLPNFKYYLPTFNIPEKNKTNYAILLLEIPLFLFQYLYMRSKITTEKVSFNKILFLKNDYSPKILKDYLG